MANRKKVLFIARWYPDRHDNMYGLFVQKHAQAIQLYHDVSVLYVIADNSLKPGVVLKEQCDFEGVKEFKIYFGKSRNEITNALYYTKHYLGGCKWVAEVAGTPELVHVHILTRTALPALWLKLTKGIPYLITEHWSRYLPVNVAQGAYQGWFRKTGARLAVSYASRVTTVTNNLAEAMKAQGLRNRYTITPNVADIHDFHPRENNSINSIKKLIHISCFDEPAKNIKGIIDVVEVLSKKRDDFILEIVGTGKDYDMVYAHAISTGLVDTRIFFTGLLTGTLLSKKLRESQALVMFSNYENLPCTIVESLCSGVPVISSDVGGIREHVFETFGTLVPAGDHMALSNAISLSLDHPEYYNNEKIREYAEKHFSMEAVGRIFSDIYNDAVRKA